MPKGSSSRLRSGGNGRAGVRDCPPQLREILQAYIETPSLLDGLPPSQRAQREEQIAAYEATRAMRSAATKAGWETRRAQKKLSVWELEDLHAAAAIEEAMVEARLAADSPSGWTFDDYFEEFVICQAWEVSLVLCEAAVATGRVSAEFVEETTARRFALDHRYDPEPASADGGGRRRGRGARGQAMSDFARDGAAASARARRLKAAKIGVLEVAIVRFCGG